MLSEGERFMQCYQYKMMLTHIYNTIVPVSPGFEYDENVLSEILDNLDVDNIRVLLNVGHQRIKAQAIPYLHTYSNAA